MTVDLSVFKGNKSVQDYSRESDLFQRSKEAFDLKKKNSKLQNLVLQDRLNAKSNDPKAIAADAVFRHFRGQELSPDDMAAIETVAAMEGGRTRYEPDEYGHVRAVTEENPYAAILKNMGNTAPNPSATDPRKLTQGTGSPLEDSQNAIIRRRAELQTQPTDFEAVMESPQSYGVPALDAAVAETPFGKKEIFKQRVKSLDPKYEQARQVEEKKAKLKKEQLARAEGNIIQDMGRSITMLEKDMGDFMGTDAGFTMSAGAPGAALKYLPGTPAYNLDKMVESAKSNISIQELQAMRESSPTGGALGQVPVQQQEYLMQLRGSLQVGQRPDILLDNMKRVFNISMDIVHGSPEQIRAQVQAGAISPERGAELMQRHSLSFDEFGRPIDNDAAPAGVPADVWEHMTPEERALFQ